LVRKFALVSTGPLSGKSTLARYLKDEYGFILANHSLTLVHSFVEDWNRTGHLLPGPITIEEVYRDKEIWRPLLQEWGFAAGFNDPNRATHWIKQTLSEWLRNPERDVVFEPARGELQAQILKEMGFEGVQIEISDRMRCQRASLLGRRCEDVIRAMNREPELERGIKQPDLRLKMTVDVPIELLSYVLLNRPDGTTGYTVTY